MHSYRWTTRRMFTAVFCAIACIVAAGNGLPIATPAAKAFWIVFSAVWLVQAYILKRQLAGMAA